MVIARSPLINPVKTASPFGLTVMPDTCDSLEAHVSSIQVEPPLSRSGEKSVKPSFTDEDIPRLWEVWKEAIKDLTGPIPLELPPF
jgi:hypothetical protein